VICLLFNKVFSPVAVVVVADRLWLHYNPVFVFLLPLAKLSASIPSSVAKTAFSRQIGI